MKKLAPRIVSLFAIAILLTSGVPAVSSAAIPAAVKLTIHYQRADTDYTNWNLWLWKNVTTGTDVDVNKAGVAFTESDDFGKIARVELDGMDKFESVGIILRARFKYQ